MLTLTRKADYAIVALADLARRGASRTSARELAESTQVPLPTLTNILHQLLRHGLVSSTMGSKGGYRLAKSALQISLAELIDAIEGPFKLALCCTPEEGDCKDEPCELVSNCQVREPLQRVHSSLRQFLNQISLAHLAFDDVPIGLNVVGSDYDLRKQSAVAVKGSE